MTDLLKRIKAASELPLTPNTVAVPDMPELFVRGEPHLLYVARLTAEEKEEFESAYDAFRTEQGIPEKSVKLFRAFAIAYCLCDSDNVLAATSPAKLAETALAINEFPNNIVSRIFTVADGTNAFFKVSEVVVKKSEEPATKTKSVAGNGDTRVISASPADEPG